MCCCKEVQGENVDLRFMRKVTLQKDCSMSVQKCKNEVPLIAEIAKSQEFWDGVLDMVH